MTATAARATPPVTGRETVPFADCEIVPAAREAAVRVMASGWVTTGPEVLAFESEFAARVNAPHAVAVASCTAALELALRSLQLSPGEPVLTSSNTFCGAVHAIVHAGLRPVLVDVDPVTGMPTEATTRAAARSCGGPAAMVVTHWAGDPADVVALAAAAGLTLDRVVEDAAHALGSKHRGLAVGEGVTACFSFYATKNLPLGEGGMVTTRDGARAEWIRSARLHGMSADAWRRYLPGGRWRYDVAQEGFKANMTDLQAAIGREQLRCLDVWQRRREEIAARYDDRLRALDGVVLPHRPDRRDSRHAWHLYPVQLLPGAGPGRDDVADALAHRGIGTSVHFIPVHHLTWLRDVVDVAPGGLPGADELFARVLSLPMYPRLTDRQVDVVCDALEACLTRSTTTGLSP